MNGTDRPSGFRAGSAATVLIRIAVGLIFGTQGILKFIDPNMGVNRFARIGFPHPGGGGVVAIDTLRRTGEVPEGPRRG